MPPQLRTVALLLSIVLVAAAGFYLTEIHQPGRLEHLKNAEKVARLQQAQVEQLLREAAASKQQSDEAVRKWKARYKYIPQAMTTPDIVQYLESHTTRGFESFNINLEGVTEKPDYSYYTFRVEGEAYYTNLYHFIWHIENNREFYLLRDLSLTHTELTDENPETGAQRRQDLVHFAFKLDAFFDGAEGLSAAEGELMPIPIKLLPTAYPAHNAFYPVVRAELPPNDRLLVDVEEAAFVSILGEQAVFKDEQGLRRLGAGDEVYLGQIIEVDPRRSRVVARLNKGGLIEKVERTLTTDDSAYRQAQGRQRLVPLQQ